MEYLWAYGDIVNHLLVESMVKKLRKEKVPYPCEDRGKQPDGQEFSDPQAIQIVIDSDGVHCVPSYFLANTVIQGLDEW